MLSLALIVKNEEKNLARLLDSVQGLYDELVIVDTGSTDRTVEIAKRYTPNVHYFEWVKHFAKARNFAFSKCTQEWIMWIDADDILKPHDVKTIREAFLANKDRLDIDYFLINYHYFVDPPTPQGTPKATQLRERIIRKSRATWRGRCHEHIPILWHRTFAVDGAAVWHLRDDEDRKADSNRNIELMLLEVDEAPTSRNYFYLGNEYSNIGKIEQAIQNYQKALDANDHINTSFQAAYKIAQAYHGTARHDLALEWYHKCLTFQVDYREPLVGIASIYQHREDHSKVVFYLEAALNVSEPKHPEMVIFKPNYGLHAHDMLAKSYFALKKYKKSIEHLEKMYELERQPHFLADIQNCKYELKKSYKRPTTSTRLNLGCGDKPLEGFVNVDLFEQPGVDEVFSLDEIPYADYSIDEIVSVHSLEHIPRPRAEQAIKEWARVLKRGGKLQLKVPDLEECCRMFVERPDEQEPWYQHTIYGVQDFRDVHTAPFKDKVNYGQIHYTGFTEARLQRLLTQAGFVIDKLYKYDGYRTPSLALEAHIPDIPAAEKKRIAFINNTLNPKYLSYGDYWEDAFCATGHTVDIFKYEQVGQIPNGYDLYFFIEANDRYPVNAVPDVFPKVIYLTDHVKPGELDHFDVIATPDETRYNAWQREGRECLLLANDNHIERVQLLLAIDYKPRSMTLADDLETQTIQVNPKTDLIPVQARTAILLRPVDVIIPSYKNVNYLRQTIKSVRQNSPEANIIVVNSGRDEATRNYLKNSIQIKLIDSLDRLSFSQAVNRGLRASQNDVVILNNDTIVGKNWLKPLQDSPYDITNPLSNCDKGWIHDFNLAYFDPNAGPVELVPNMFDGSVNPQILMDMPSPKTGTLDRNQPGQSWVAFYATYIKRQVLEQTGYLDEDFVNGGEDYDFCRRAVKHGYTCGHVFDSFVFHYGGKTRKISEEENYVQHHKEDDLNNAYMKFKDRPTVAIYTGQAWEPWTIDSINTTGIGGSETCAAMLAREFARNGYRSVLFGHCEGMEGEKEGVEYVHYTRYDTWKEVNHIDYFISSRKMSPLAHKVQNTKNYVWSHDIFIPECYGRHPDHSDRVTKFICLSPWHVDFFSQHHSVSKDKIYIQGNGLDLSRYDKRHSIAKDPYRLIYSSSPDRGLLTLLQMFPGWRAEFPQANLHIFYGFDNWEKAIKQRNNPEEVQHLQAIKHLMNQPGVHYHGRISQEQLAREQMQASIWAYPTQFTETFCITATENMLAGAVPVCTTVAALKTTVPDGCGVKVDQPWDVSNAVLDLFRNPHKLEEYRKRGEAHVLKTCGWETVVQNWIRMFETT